MSLKAINKKYQHSVAGITVGSRAAARDLQRALRAGGTPVEESKIVQRLLIERVVR